MQTVVFFLQKIACLSTQNVLEVCQKSLLSVIFQFRWNRKTTAVINESFVLCVRCIKPFTLSSHLLYTSLNMDERDQIQRKDSYRFCIINKAINTTIWKPSVLCIHLLLLQNGEVIYPQFSSKTLLLLYCKQMSVWKLWSRSQCWTFVLV